MISDFSGATIVIFIALGALVLVLLFIFAKRQIMRFALRSRRGPHVPIGHSAPRWLRKEIERRLDLVGRIKHEPKLVSEASSADTPNPETLCRMQAMDDLKILEIQLQTADPKACRMPNENLRPFLMAQLPGILKTCQPKTIHLLCDLYERARFSPDGFSSNHLENYRELVANLVQISQMNKSSQANSSPKIAMTTKMKKKKETTASTSL
ncbi:protein C1orf43 homolog [Daphnia magna]|uniref:Uncharacterized protein n=1 Tax=Daphnia magna TaxID=35525 RepID=A0ABR0AUM6_9CRUS|nr:protein C1orf43 homolog [Daphnia magna]XP_045022893.1 protein C1orf43 homolog [Daphnia magna]KAK4028831.1 hypothetical protein OUZ56_021849 [Daphnia magna]